VLNTPQSEGVVHWISSAWDGAAAGAMQIRAPLYMWQVVLLLQSELELQDRTHRPPEPRLKHMAD
jgi:hypothetical protein